MICKSYCVYSRHKVEPDDVNIKASLKVPTSTHTGVSTYFPHCRVAVAQEVEWVIH